MAKAPENDEVECKGCKKDFDVKKLLRHIGQSKDCKIKYGKEFETMKKASRKKTYSKYNKDNSVKINANQRIYDREREEF